MNQSPEAIETASGLVALSGKMRIVILGVILVGLAVSLYKGTLWDLAMSVLHRENSSHGLCVPFISGYLIWIKSKRLKELKPDFALVPGMVIVGIGFLLFMLGGERKEVVLPPLSFLVVAAGFILMLFSKEVSKELRFPLFFLATMIPLPEPWYAQLTEGMRMATTGGAVWLLKLFSFPIYREAYNVHIPHMMLSIDPACSGIRYLIPYFVFGLAYAYACKRTLRSRATVVLATIPLSVIAGVLRQSTIILAAHYIGPFMAEHRPHVMISWFVFITVLVGAMGVDRGITRRKAGGCAALGVRFGWRQERRAGIRGQGSGRKEERTWRKVRGARLKV